MLLVAIYVHGTPIASYQIIQNFIYILYSRLYHYIILLLKSISNYSKNLKF